MAVAAFTVQNALDEFHETYSTLTAAQKLTLFLQVFREVCGLAQIEAGSQDESLTDGTREYEIAYAPRISSIREALYITSASARKQLKPISTDWLDQNAAGWREDTQTGEPWGYYIEAQNSSGVTVEGKIVVGLHPIPDTTSTGSPIAYPFLRLYGTHYEDLAATDKIPAIFPNVTVFAAGMRAKYAARRDLPKAAMYDDLWRRELHATLAFIDQLQEDADPKIVPTWLVSQPVQ